MLKLVAKSPAEGLVPLSVGKIELNEVVPAAITSIACYHGQADALSAALKQHHGMAMPKRGRRQGARVHVRYGRDHRYFWWVQNHMQTCQTTPQSSTKATVGVF